MKKKLLSALLALALTLATAAIPAAAAEVDSASEAISAQPGAVTLGGALTHNIDEQNLSASEHKVNSYLSEKPDGTLERVEYDTDTNRLFYEWYSSDGKILKKTGVIKTELPIFGGVFIGSDFNYVVFGQKNENYDDTIEILRAVKYTKEWKRVSAASVFGANTLRPFAVGTVSITEKDGRLYIHTCHTMYPSKDGYNHQANMTFLIRESDMTVIQDTSEVDPIYISGFVSHSFGQRILTDDENVYRVDRGDSHPNAIVITKSSHSIGIKASGRYEEIYFYKPILFKGESDNVFYNASIGDFALVGNKCVIAVKGEKNYPAGAFKGDRNIWLSITDKDFSSTKNIQITDYPVDSETEVSTPSFVKISGNRLLLMWEEYNQSRNEAFTKLAVVNADGELDSQGIVATNLPMSDCHPIFCKDGLVKWYAGFYEKPVMYSVNPSALAKSASSQAMPGEVVRNINLNLGDRMIVMGYDFIADTYKNGFYSEHNFRFHNVYLYVHKSAPKLISALPSVSGGIAVKWQADKNSLYEVLRKNSAGKWESIGTAYNYAGSSELTFADLKAENGKTYTYTVQELDPNSYGDILSGYDANGLSATCIDKPVITKTETTSGSIKVSWTPLGDAKAYQMYVQRRDGEVDYDYTTSATNYTLKNLTPGVRYDIQVCGIDKYGYYGKWSDKTSVTLVSQPLLSLSNNSAGLTATWSNTGADSYVVYYRPAERSAWSSFTATANKAVIPNTESGKLYCVQVQNVSGSKKGTYSKVKSMTYLSRANITSVTYSGSNSLQWNAVDGANQYQIARKKTGDKAYTYYTTAKTAFTEQNVTAGTTYTYQVRAMYKTEKNGTAYGEWSSSKSVVTIEKPELRLSNEKNGVRL